MAKEKDRDITLEFLQIVEAHGGENCRHWTKVARVFYESTGIQVNQTYKLRKRWETLTGYKEKMNEEQTRILYETGIKCRGNNKGGQQSFQDQTGIKIYLGRYTKSISKWLRGSLKMFEEMFMHDKKTRYRRVDEEMYRLSYVSIHIMLRAADIKDSEGDPMMEELKWCAQKLEQLLMIHAKYIKEYNKNEREEYYHIYKDLINRNQFRKIMFFLDYANELKQISISYYQKLDILAHPLLKKTIELNKKSLIYQKIILESDWQSKYQLYNQCQVYLESQNQEYSMLIKKASKKKQSESNDILQNYDVVSKATHKASSNKLAHAQIMPCEKQKLRTFRGHYVRPGQIKSKGWTTILFDHDVHTDDDGEDYEKINKQRQEANRWQQIMSVAFPEDERLEEEAEKQRKALRKEKPYSF